MQPNRTALGTPKRTGAERTLFWRNLRRLGYDSYQKYLASSHWKQTRKAYYADPDTPKVCICGTDEGLALHHLTYERLGAERPEDLHPLCNDCHLTVHRLARAGLTDIRLQGYMSDLRRSRYARERREALECQGVKAEDWPEEPFDTVAWKFNAQQRWEAAKTPERKSAELKQAIRGLMAR